MLGRFSSSRLVPYTRCDVGFGRSAQPEEPKEPRLILMMNQDVAPREVAVLPSAERLWVGYFAQVAGALKFWIPNALAAGSITSS
jgi:hypothetical protein